jgi:hypothetical protein
MRRILAVTFSFFLGISTAALSEEVKVEIGGKSIRMSVEKATEGDGYSVQSSIDGVAPLCINVSLSCADGSSASACCPTVNYDTFCPKARIVCR